MPDKSSTSPAAVAALAVSSIALGGVLAVLAYVASGRGDQESASRGPRRSVKFAAVDDEDDDTEEPAKKPKRSGSLRRAEGQPAPNPFADTEESLGINCGFSMEEARLLAEEGHAAAKNKTPPEVLSDLQKGNARFWTGTAVRVDKTPFQRRALISKQYPSVAILGCSDSRVPIEIVFDQGLGDMFVIRVAGNCLGTTTSASLQYAVHHLKVKVVMVLGHEGCGAVKAAQLPPDAINKEPACLGGLLNGLREGLNLERLNKVRDAKAHDREAVVTNVKRQVERLTSDDCIMSKVGSGELLIVGAFYEISSGIVDFFHEVSEEMEPNTNLSPISRTMERRPSRGVLTRFNSRLAAESDEEAS